MSDTFYIVLFVAAGAIWTALAALGIGAYLLFTRLHATRIKPTQWHREWERIERNISE